MLFWRLYDMAVKSTRTEEMKKYCTKQMKLRQQFEDQVATVEHLRKMETL